MEWLISEGAFNRNRKSASKQAILFNTFGGGSLYIYPGEGLINGCMFLFTSRWAYHFGANKWEGLQATVYGMFTPILYSK